MKTLLLILLVVAVPLIGNAQGMSIGEKPAVQLASGYAPGDRAESFSLKNVDGAQVSLDNFSDAKGFIVVFTCNHCPFSVAYEDRIIQLDKTYKSLGYPVIALNPNDPQIQPEDSYDNMKKRAKQKKFSFPYLLDEGGVYAHKYGATKTPHVYLLQKKADGLSVAYIGAIDNNSKSGAEADQKYLENALKELIAGKEVSVKTTKAIGCSIKYSKS